MQTERASERERAQESARERAHAREREKERESEREIWGVTTGKRPWSFAVLIAAGVSVQGFLKQHTDVHGRILRQYTYVRV
jgi:hypothetical protein